MIAKPSPRGVAVRAFAKINVSLRVLGTRPDGFHELRTVFQSIGLHDTITFTPARGALTLECDDPRVPVDSTNLVIRAAERLWRAAGRRGAPTGVRIVLKKRIPMQGGLGGGSSDAAAALRALSVLWRVPLTAERSAALAASLGADVAFFLSGGTALGLERGDVLFQLVDGPAEWVTLVLPDFGVSTKEAYGWWDADQRLRGARSRRSPLEVANDFQEVVARRRPEISRIVRALKASGARRAAMSGSGSAVFGLFASEEQAARALGGSLRAYRGVVTSTVNLRRYQRLAAPHALMRRQPIV